MKNLILLDTQDLSDKEIEILCKAIHAFKGWDCNISAWDNRNRPTNGRVLLGIHTDESKALISLYSYSDIPSYSGDGYNIVIVEDYETLLAKSSVQLKYYH